MKNLLLVIFLLVVSSGLFAQNSIPQNINTMRSLKSSTVKGKDGKEINIVPYKTPDAPKGTITSVQDGNWGSWWIWDALVVPTVNDDVIINNNVTVTNNDFHCNNLTINPGKTLTLNSIWWLYVHGNCINNGIIQLNNGTIYYNTMLILYGDFTNAGTLVPYGEYSAIYFAGSTNQTFNNTGTISEFINEFDVDNTAGITIDKSGNQIPVFRINLYDGNITNSDKITLGYNLSGYYGIVQRGGNSGTIASGTFDKYPTLNLSTNGQLFLIYYTALPITTGYEIPSNFPVYYFRSANVQNTTLNSDVSISNTLALDSGRFNINGKTVTLNNNAIAVGHGTIAGGTTSNIIFNGTTAATLPNVINGINNLTINNIGGVTLSGNNTIYGTTTMTNGLLNTGSNTLTFANSATNPSEISTSRIVGTAVMDSRSIGTGSIYFLNCNIAASAGGGDIGSVTITRKTGSAVIVGGNAGILSSWNITTTIPSVTRNITYEWLSNYDNGHIFGGTNKAQIYKSTNGSIWTTSGSPVDVSALNPRSITTTGESPSMRWTVSSQDAPLPVTLSSFSASVNSNNVSLKWVTSNEINNSGFDVERSEGASNQYTKIGFVKGNGTKETSSEYTFTDSKLNSGKYQYRLKQLDLNGNFEYHNLTQSIEVALPSKIELAQNYPNPFNPSTKIDFTLPSNSKVKISIFDMTGKEVAVALNDTRSAGYHTIQFNASNLSSGVYFYKLDISSNEQNISLLKKMVLIK